MNEFENAGDEVGTEAPVEPVEGQEELETGEKPADGETFAVDGEIESVDGEPVAVGDGAVESEPAAEEPGQE
jgi:hypothetical protein